MKWEKVIVLLILSDRKNRVYSDAEEREGLKRIGLVVKTNEDKKGKNIQNISKKRGKLLKINRVITLISVLCSIKIKKTCFYSVNFK